LIAAFEKVRQLNQDHPEIWSAWTCLRSLKGTRRNTKILNQTNTGGFLLRGPTGIRYHQYSWKPWDDIKAFAGHPSGSIRQNGNMNAVEIEAAVSTLSATRRSNASSMVPSRMWSMLGRVPAWSKNDPKGIVDGGDSAAEPAQRDGCGGMPALVDEKLHTDSKTA
jgi:hypothetical protein